jgi:hypothetical protein
VIKICGKARIGNICMTVEAMIASGNEEAE